MSTGYFWYDKTDKLEYDFDSLYEQGTGNRLVYMYTESGQDLGMRYLPASYGKPGQATEAFYDRSGNDVGPQFCALGGSGTYGFSIDLDSYSSAKQVWTSPIVSSRQETDDKGSDSAGDDVTYTVNTYRWIDGAILERHKQIGYLVNLGFSAEDPTVGGGAPAFFIGSKAYGIVLAGHGLYMYVDDWSGYIKGSKENIPATSFTPTYRVGTDWKGKTSDKKRSTFEKAIRFDKSYFWLKSGSHIKFTEAIPIGTTIECICTHANGTVKTQRFTTTDGATSEFFFTDKEFFPVSGKCSLSIACLSYAH